MKLTNLSKRSDFLYVKSGNKYRGSFFILQSRKRLSNNILKFNMPRIGFIVTKKNGNAVKRNKIKRRLRAAINNILIKENFSYNTDYIIITYPNIINISFQCLLNELSRIFKETLS